MKDKLAYRVTLIVLILLGLRLAASFFPDTRLWGFNHAAFLGYLWLIYPLFMAAAVYLYFNRKKMVSSTGDMPETTSVTGGNAAFYTAVLIIACGLLFYFLRVKAYFLGDGATILANPEMTIKHREFGEVIIHTLFIRLIGTATTEYVLLGYRILSIASGLCFVALLAYYTRKLAATRFDFWILTLLILLSANTILFYGYVENYSLTAFVLGIMVLSAAASLKQGGKSVVPVVAFAVAVFLHSISLTYLPAILIYLLLTYGGKRLQDYAENRAKIIITVLLAMLAVFYIAVRLWAPPFWRMAFLSPFGDRLTTDRYFLLSPNHLADYLNLIVFLVPVFLIVWVLTLTSRRDKTANPARPETMFVLTASIFGLASLFLLEPKLGMARDWDLMSLLVIGAIIGGPYLWISRFGQHKMFRPASYLLLLLTLAGFIPWLTLHNSVDALANYSTAAMKLDPKHSRPGLLTMGSWLESQGKSSEAQRMLDFCRQNFPEKDIEKEGADYYGRGDYTRAESTFKLALKENPSWFALYTGLGMCQIKMGKYSEALENLYLADGLNPYNAVIYNYLGEALMGLNDTARALEYWHKSADGDIIVPPAFVSLGVYHLRNRRPDSALSYFSEIPDALAPLEVYYWRGLADLMATDTAEALKSFNAYLSLGSDSALIKNIDRIKASLLTDTTTPPPPVH